jgi:hypothetical protein
MSLAALNAAIGELLVSEHQGLQEATRLPAQRV